MQDSEKRAVRRTLAAEDLADEVDAITSDRHRQVYVRVSARFHLLAHDAGIDRSDPEEAAFVAAVLQVLNHTNTSVPTAFAAAVIDTVECYRQVTA